MPEGKRRSPPLAPVVALAWSATTTVNPVWTKRASDAIDFGHYSKTQLRSDWIAREQPPQWEDSSMARTILKVLLVVPLTFLWAGQVSLSGARSLAALRADDPARKRHHDRPPAVSLIDQHGRHAARHRHALRRIPWANESRLSCRSP